MFKDAKEAISWIENIKRKSPRENLNRMKEFMAILSNPEKIYKTIHIAGTNGKGATCEFCSSILENKSELSTFSTIIGSNIGAYLTPIGALAGIMWMSILKRYSVNFSFLDFVKYGLILVPVSLVFSTLGIIILC